MNLKINDLLAFSNTYKKLQDMDMPTTLAFRLLKIKKEVDECLAFYQEKYNGYLTQYVEKDEDGKFKMTENNEGFLLIPETIKEAHEKFKELDETDFPIKAEKITLFSFSTLNLSPTLLEGLLPFLEKE